MTAKLANELAIWRAVQIAIAIAAVILVGLLIWLPDIGIALFWNCLIPVAPAILVLIPGVWRNICPMATVGLLPRKLGFSKRKALPQALRSAFTVVSMTCLLLIVPLRHTVLNTSGPATAMMLVTAAATAFLLGTQYEWRSAWCSSLCPIHPVEKLYGTAPAITVRNAQCTACEKCVRPCPDSTRKMTPLISDKSSIERNAGSLLVGGFFGYVYGWYQVPDYFGPMTVMEWVTAFTWPLGGFVASFLVYQLLRAITSKSNHVFLGRVFATAAATAYYWFRLPMLFGYSDLPNNGSLVDLTSTMPGWFVFALQAATLSFFTGFMLLRKPSNSWSIRPAYSDLALTKE